MASKKICKVSKRVTEHTLPRGGVVTPDVMKALDNRFQPEDASPGGKRDASCYRDDSGPLWEIVLSTVSRGG